MRPSVPGDSALVPQLSEVEGSRASVVPLTELRGIRFWAIPLAMLGLTLTVLVALAVISDASTREGVSALSQSLAMLLATIAGLVLLWRVPSGRARWSWGCVSLAFVTYLLADIVAIILSNILPPTQATYLSGAVFLPFYPLLAIGVLLLPSASRTGVQQIRVILDVFIGVSAIFGLELAFLIAPRFASGSILDLVYIIYPVGDFGLLLVAVLLLVRGVQRTYRPAFFWLLVGMACFVYADSTFNYLTLPTPGHEPGANQSFGLPVVDPFWLAGIFAFCLASFSLLARSDPGAGWDWIDRFASFGTLPQRTRTLAQFALLIVPVAILFGLVVFNEIHPQQQEARLPLEVLTFLVVLLIIIRLLLTMRDLVDARIATERAERLDSLKDQFITSVNHELRTPLMTVQGYVQLLADPQVLGTEEKRVDMLERTNRACGNLVHLVQSILDTRRIDQEAHDFVPEVVNVRAAAEAALALIDPREADPTHHEITLLIPPQLVIWGDTIRLQQIFTNLFSNAVKYSPLGSSVTVVGHMVSEKKPHMLAANRSAQRRQLVEITVKDQGLGIPPEQIPLLFRRFVRLPRDIASTVRGTGLGLHLCKVFTEAMGGQIWVESSGVPGEGSTFHLRLPAPALTNNPAELPPAAVVTAR